MDARLLSFLGLCTLLCASPGPGNVFVVSLSLRYGSKTGIFTALGITVGSAFKIVATSFGLATLVASFPQAVTLIQVFGGCFVIYLSIAMRTKAAVSPAANAVVAVGDTANTLSTGLVSNLLNPVDLLFYAIIVPSFVPDDGVGHSSRLWFFGLAVTYLTINLVAKCGLSMFAGHARTLFAKNLRFVNTFAATMMLLVGCFLAGKSGFDLLAPLTEPTVVHIWG